MKKSIVLIIVVLMMGLSGKASAGSVVAADLNCTNPTGCVQTSEISDGAVTNGKIADGAVTDVKIIGPISASKVEKPANVVVVAKQGGDFTSISAALAAINPTADNPYLIKVMPGIYNEANFPAIPMKSYVELKGSGRDVTTINAGATAIIVSCQGVTHVTISGFTITDSNYGVSDMVGMLIHGSSFVTIEDNYFTGNIDIGIYLWESPDTVVIRNNTFTLLGRHYNRAILAYSSAMISDNTFKNNYFGIQVESGSPIIKENEFVSNAVGLYGGASAVVKDNIITGNSNGIEFFSGNAIVTHNKIVGNIYDVFLYDTVTTNLSFNIFDTLGTRYSGQGIYIGKYNLKSDGTDAPTTTAP